MTCSLIQQRMDGIRDLASGPLASLTDAPTPASFSIQKVVTAFKATFEYTWPGVERPPHHFSNNFIKTDFCRRDLYLLSLQPPEEIQKQLRPTLEREIGQLPAINLETLDPVTKIIHKILTTGDEKAIVELVTTVAPSQITSQDQVIPLVKSAFATAFNKHPELLRCAWEHRQDNLVAGTWATKLLNDHEFVKEVMKEQDRMTKIQRILNEHLVASQNYMTDFTNQQTESFQGTNPVCTTRLEGFRQIITLINDRELRTITLE